MVSRELKTQNNEIFEINTTSESRNIIGDKVQVRNYLGKLKRNELRKVKFPSMNQQIGYKVCI